MTQKKFICPPLPATGSGTFSDDLVGFQLVQGGGLTQGNFEFVSGTEEKQNRTFRIGAFSDPISLESMNIQSVEESKLMVENNFKVYPNFDLSQISTFTLYGSLNKRLSVSIQTIISYFPAGLESTKMGLNFATGETAFNISYNSVQDETTFDLDLSRIRNPFEIDFTTNSTRNLSLREIKVSPLRDLPVEYAKYSLYYIGEGYQLTGIEPTDSLTNGTLRIYVKGNPFSGQSVVYEDLVVRPNDQIVNKVFNEDLDEVENFLLNRNISPIYTAYFSVPTENDDGSYFINSQFVTFPLYGNWNLDIITGAYDNYITNLAEIGTLYDSYKTNLVSRFLTTASFKDFDTPDEKVEKVLQIYGRSFDETKKFIEALAFMNSVNYNVGDDIPSQLLKNLAQTLGWNVNISPISNEQLLNSVFGGVNSNESQFLGISQQTTPDELNYQFYRALILNAAYLFKSKGTRKSIENLLKLIGAPDALVEFNEHVYLADQRIDMSQFYEQYAQISGGTYLQELPAFDPTNTYKIHGTLYTGFTTTLLEPVDVGTTREDYPVDEFGFPYPPDNSDTYFFQIGSGWFEQTPQHRANEVVDLTYSVFTGSNPNFQTTLVPYTYGQVYLNRFRNFPFMSVGFELTRTIDNNKSWVDNEIGKRTNFDGNYNSLYYTDSDSLVMNVKNVDIFMNPAQGLVYDVWYMSSTYNYPFSNNPLNLSGDSTGTISLPYPQRNEFDITISNPQPKRKTFFEFAQTFWQNLIDVRNRQFVKDGKTGGYPTLQSIYWRYLESESIVGIENNNFNYTNMMEYVDGLGDYWIRLIEQMIPASTLWMGGIKYENSAFHRQKFVWRRQMGCELVPIPCKPCTCETNIFPTDCPVHTVECCIFPWYEPCSSPLIQSFNNILGNTLNSYLTPLGYSLDNCFLPTMTSEWYVNIKLDGSNVYNQSFFNGTGFTGTLSVPSENAWYSAVLIGLNSLSSLGYGYYFPVTSDVDVEFPNLVALYNTTCSSSAFAETFEINVGIKFNILCSL